MTEEQEKFVLERELEYSAAEKASEEFERDSRRYSAAFTEEERVKLKWN